MERFDSWLNTQTGLGSVRDKSIGITFQRRSRLTREQLDALYEQNAVVARVVDRLPYDALREGWELENVVMRDGGEPDLPAIMSKCEDMNLMPTLSKAVSWSRLYGGALVTLPAFDQQDPALPLDLGKVQDFYVPSVVSSNECRPYETDVAFGSPTYRKTISYEIDGIVEGTIRVHHSRVIPFEPIEMPIDSTNNYRNFGWGPSVIERIFDELARDGAGAQHATSMMFVASLLTLQLDGFKDAHKTAKGREQLRTLLQGVFERLSAAGLLALDKEDMLGATSLTLSGVHQVLDALRQRFAAAADMPKEIVFNESPAGLNAGELSGPQELWFAFVAAFQQRVLTPALNRLLEVAFAAWGLPIESWTIKWRPLWTKSDTARSEIYTKDAAADAIYFQMGALTADEIRDWRFVQGRTGPIQLPQPEEAEPPALDFSDELEGYEIQLAPPSPAPAPADLESPQDAAVRWGVPTRTITKALQTGELDHWLVGSHRRVSAALVDRWVHERSASAKPSGL